MAHDTSEWLLPGPDAPTSYDLSKALPRDPDATDRFLEGVVNEGAYHFLDRQRMTGAWPGIIPHTQDQDATGAAMQLARHVSEICWVVRAIINTRIAQMRRFTRVSRQRFQPGYKVTTRDPDQEITDAVKRRCQELERFVEECGWKPRPPDQVERPWFPDFVSRAGNDTLVFGAHAFEVWPGNLGSRYPVAEFEAVDVSMIRRTLPTIYEPGSAAQTTIGGQKHWPKVVHFVQMRQGRPVAEFGRDQLMYVARNQRTDVRNYAYGVSELESLIKVVTGLLFGLDYNVKYFTNDTIPRGLINIVGNYSDQQIATFRAQWIAMLQGPANYHKTPIMATRDGQGANWVPMSLSNKDMEYGAFIEFLVACCCMVYLIHPEEIGFKGWSQQHPTLSEGLPLADLQWSSDKGLKPLLETVVEDPTDRIVKRIDEDFKFELVAKERDEWREWKDRAQFFYTISLWTPNDIADQLDMPRVPAHFVYGDLPLGNPDAMRIAQQQLGLGAQGAGPPMMAAPQEQEQGQFQPGQGPDMGEQQPGQQGVQGPGPAPGPEVQQEVEKSMRRLLEVTVDA